MQLNNLVKNASNKKSIRIGRGGKRGKTSGRGHKGQNARAGNSKRPAIRDLIKTLPKLRGQGVHGNKNREIINKYFPINLSQIVAVFKDGEEVNQNSLFEKGLVEKKSGKLPRVKILANGEIDIKVEVKGLLISETAKEKIEKAGGKVTC
jgi:large subunit ribosomal protein L15